MSVVVVYVILCWNKFDISFTFSETTSTEVSADLDENTLYSLSDFLSLEFGSDATSEKVSSEPNGRYNPIYTG